MACFAYGFVRGNNMLKGKYGNGIGGKIDQGIFWVLVGLFLVPISVREMILSDFYQINIFAALGCFFTLRSTLKGGKLRKNHFIPYVIIACLTVILILSEIHAGRTVKGFVRVFLGLIMPLPLLFYEMYNPRKTIRIVLSVFKLVSAIVVVWGIIDVFTVRHLIVLYYNLAHDSNYADMASKSLRLYSYIGHPLYNAELFLMTFGLNFTYNELVEKNHKKDMWIILLTMIGVAMTASKSAIAIFLALLIVFYVKSIRYTIFSLAILAIGYFNGIFDLVLQRFSGSLSTGRDEVWERISSKGVTFFHFFWGNGSDSKYKYAYLEEWARAAFEYPYRLYALEFGILFMILIFLFLFVIPESRIVKNRTGMVWISIMFLAVVAHVNMYNGIGTYSDPMYLFCLFGCVTLNLSAYVRREEIEKNE